MRMTVMRMTDDGCKDEETGFWSETKAQSGAAAPVCSQDMRKDQRQKQRGEMLAIQVTREEWVRDKDLGSWHARHT